MLIGFEHVAAAPKKLRDEQEQDAPVHESMRGTRTLTTKPSTDEKKIKRRIKRNAADEGIEIQDHPIGDDLWSTASMVDVPPACSQLQRREAANQWGDWADAKPPATDPSRPGNQNGRYEWIGTGSGVRGVGGLRTDDLNEAKGNVERTGGGLVHDHQLGKTMRYEFHPEPHPWDKAMGITSSMDYALEAREMDATERRIVASSGADNRKLAWSDLRYLQTFLQTLSGSPANVTYTGDMGVEVVSGQMVYDGNHVTVTTPNGHIVSVPASDVLRADPAEGQGASYDEPQPPIDTMAKHESWNPFKEADYGTRADPIEDEPHALEHLMDQFRQNHQPTHMQSVPVAPEDKHASVHEADSWTKVEHPVRVPSDALDPARFQSDDPNWPAELRAIQAANAAYLARLRGTN